MEQLMKKSKEIELKISSDIFSKEAVITTCCQFLNDTYAFLEKLPGKNNDIAIRLTPKEPGVSHAELRECFKNELINNTLRYNIAERNKDIREHIIKTALFFSQGSGPVEKNIFDSGQDTALDKNWEEDPLKIAIPWEEKNRTKPGKKRKAKKC
jgi:His-Xaa-Ser system protein HxsD